MSDIDAPLRYAEPAEDRSAHEGNIGLLVLLALGLACAAIALAMLTRDAAEPFVLAILAGLSVVGVFSLFAGAVGILHFGDRAGGSDIARSFVDNLPEGAMVTNGDGAVLYANDAYKRLLGTDDEDQVLTVERAFAGNARAAEPLFRLAKAARQGRAWSEEFSTALEPAEGSSDEGLTARGRWYRVSVRQMPPVPGSIRRAMLTVWQVAEVTGQRQAEDEGFETLQQMIDYLDRAPAGFLSANREGQIDYVNATLAQWLDLDIAQAAAGKVHLKDILSGDTAALLTGGGDGAPEERRLDIDLQRADGTHVPVRILQKGLPAGDAQDASSQMLVLNRSPSAARDSDARAAEVRFSRFFHSAPIAIATVQQDGKIGNTNAAFMRMFADRGEGLVEGQTALADLVGEDARARLLEALDHAGDGKGATEPVDVAFGAGDERNGHFYVSPVERAEGEQEAAIVYAIDTTQQRALEMQIQQSEKMKSVGQLAGGIAHDFNNVLTAIIGFSELLLANHRPTDPAFQDIMNIKNNANRAAGLVRQLLAFSRQQTLRPQTLLLTDVLGDLKILLDRLLGEKVKLDVDHGRDLWLVKADLHQFEQVVINLAVNARDAMPDGGGLSIRTANVSERESEQLALPGMVAGEYVLCEVTDTGTGMPKEVMDKIFEPFFSTKEVGKGTGLGLSTVFGIVKQSGGYIYPESEEGQGTTFRIYLPREHEKEKSASAEAAEDVPEKKKDLTGSGTVLLVEDEEAVRSFAVRALASRGYNVLEAGTGAEALEVMNEHSGEVDIVVSDVVMPEMDGPTLLKKLRKRNDKVKVIFISGYAEDAFKKNLEGEEDFAFLPKPFSLKQLAEAVKETLEG